MDRHRRRRGRLIPSKAERIAHLVEVLRSAPPLENLDAARDLLVNALAGIECSCGADFPMRMPSPAVICYDTRAHFVFVAHNGAILIREKRGVVLLDAPGVSGDRVAEIAPWLCFPRGS